MTIGALSESRICPMANTAVATTAVSGSSASFGAARNPAGPPSSNGTAARRRSQGVVRDETRECRVVITCADPPSSGGAQCHPRRLLQARDAVLCIGLECDGAERNNEKSDSVKLMVMHARGYAIPE